MENDETSQSDEYKQLKEELSEIIRQSKGKSALEMLRDLQEDTKNELSYIGPIQESISCQLDNEISCSRIVDTCRTGSMRCMKQ